MGGFKKVYKIIDTPQHMNNVKEFKRLKLASGAVVLFEKRDLPIVTVMAAIPFGAGHEASNVKGIAHFIEHMAFKGTKTKTIKEIKEPIDRIGGELNAFTIREITGFFAKIPSKYVERGIDIVSDIMLNPVFNAKEMEKERGVILEEIKMIHDDPSAYSIRKITELLYEKPFGTFVAGTKETVSKIQRNDMLKWHDSNYYPENMIIAVVGNVEIDNVLEILNQRLKKSPASKKIIKTDVKLKNENLIEKRKDINQAHIVFGAHMPTLKDKLRYASYAFNTILAHGSSSRLYTEIREKRGLAYRVGGYLQQEKDYGCETIYVGTMKDKVKKVKELILKEIKKMQNLKNSDLEKAKEQIIGSYELSKETSENTAENLIIEEIAGNAGDYYKLPEYVSAINLEDVRRLAKIKNYSFLEVIPA